MPGARSGFAAALVLGLAALLSFGAAAQPWPAGPVKLVVPFTPGGTTDTLARLLAHRLQETWNQPVVVEYKPGASTVIGADFVAKSAADGRTIGLVNSSFTVNPSLRKSLPYDTARDFRGITQVASVQTVLVARTGAPFNDMREMLAYARANPGKLTYGNSAIGSPSHLLIETLKKREKLDFLTVSFKGGAQVSTELLGQRIDMATEPLAAVLAYLTDGRVKVIAPLGDTRLRRFPQVAPVSDSLPGLSATAMLGLVAPARTPDAVVAKIHADVAAILGSEDMQRRLNDLGMEAVGSPPEVFDGFLRQEAERWRKVVPELGIVLE